MRSNGNVTTRIVVGLALALWGLVATGGPASAEEKTVAAKSKKGSSGWHVDAARHSKDERECTQQALAQGHGRLDRRRFDACMKKRREGRR